MKKFIILLVFVFCFSLTTYANIEEFDNSSNYYVTNGLVHGNSDYIIYSNMPPQPLANGLNTMASSSDFKYYIGTDCTIFGDYIEFSSYDDSVLFSYSSDCTFKITNVRSVFTGSGGTYYVKHDFNTQLEFNKCNWEIQFRRLNGEWFTYDNPGYVFFDCDSTVNTGSQFDISCTFNSLPFDVYGVRFVCTYDVNNNGTDLDNLLYSGHINWYNGFQGSEFYVNEYTADEQESDDEQKKTNNLLQTIIDTIIGIPKKIVDGIADIFDDFFESIKGLFIPDSSDFDSLKDDWQSLLSDRFGAIYQAFYYVIDFVSQFEDKDSVKSIEMPVVSVPIVDDTFTFGGFSVNLVPEGFEGIVEILKKLISLVCTIGFLNVMKGKLSDIVGGGSHDN